VLENLGLLVSLQKIVSETNERMRKLSDNSTVEQMRVYFDVLARAGVIDTLCGVLRLTGDEEVVDMILQVC
jgi:hypothetical protein